VGLLAASSLISVDARAEPNEAVVAKVHRRSEAMRSAGFVMTFFGVPTLLAGALLWIDDCPTYGRSGSGAAEPPCVRNQRIGPYVAAGGALLLGSGITLMVVGSQKVQGEPSPTAQVVPWATAQSGGVLLHLSL
jgi:hypothetical protein